MPSFPQKKENLWDARGNSSEWSRCDLFCSFLFAKKREGYFIKLPWNGPSYQGPGVSGRILCWISSFFPVISKLALSAIYFFLPSDNSMNKPWINRTFCPFSMDRESCLQRGTGWGMKLKCSANLPVLLPASAVPPQTLQQKNNITGRRPKNLWVTELPVSKG